MQHPLSAICGDVCPGCGRASVRLLQCGWLTAVRGCDQPDCLHPLLGPVRAVARPYTDMALQLAATAAGPAAAPADSVATAAALADLLGQPSPQRTAATVESAASVSPEEVFVRCLCPAQAGCGPLPAALAVAMFCRAPGGPLAGHRAAYRRCLRTVRATFRLSTAAAGVASAPTVFRGLALDAEMSAAVDRELAGLDAGLAGELADLLAVIGPGCRGRDRLYSGMRLLFRYCGRSVVSLRQMCTACFQQRSVRSRCTVLRLTSPAADFDLAQPLKRVLLRRCPNCGAPDQRVLFTWEAVGQALVLESPNGLAESAHSRRIVVAAGAGSDAAEFAPAALVERRWRRPTRPQFGLGDNADGDTDCVYIAWLYSPENERWMAMTPSCRFACYEEAQPGLHPPGLSASDMSSDILCVVYERVTPPPPHAGGDVSDSESLAESLDQREEEEEAAMPPPPTAPTAVPAAASEVGDCDEDGRPTLRQRLHSVMRSRRYDPAGLCDGFVMSRFLDGVATCAAAAASTVGGGSGGGGSRCSSIRSRSSRRLRSYAEDRLARRRRDAAAASVASTAADSAAASTTAGDVGDADFDIFSLFV